MTTKAPRRLPLMPIIAGLGGIAVIATVLLTMSSQGTAGEYGQPGITGDALPLAGDSTDLALGLPIPGVVGANFAGDDVVIARDGRPKVLIFLAHWCPHCQAEVPIVQQWVDSGNLPDGLDLIAIATATSSTRPNFPPSEWLRTEGWETPTIVDDSDYSIAAAYGLSAYPFWVFVAPDGTVAGRTTGELPPETISQIAQTLLAMVPAG